MLHGHDDKVVAMSDSESDRIRQVSSELDALSIETRRFVSTYAYVLARVARIDPGLSVAERGLMERAIIEAAGVSEAQAALVVQIAHSLGSLFGATEDYVMTREFARSATREQCEALLRAGFAVSAADQAITDSERAELNEIGVELGFSNDEIEAIEYDSLGGPARH